MELVIHFGDRKQKERLWAYLKSLKEKPYRIAVVQFRERRTDAQNAYYWGVVIKLIAEHIGLRPDEYDQLHTYLKVKFNSKDKQFGSDGEVISLPGSTASMTTEEFWDYIETVCAWAMSEHQIYIPLPNEESAIK